MRPQFHLFAVFRLICRDVKGTMRRERAVMSMALAWVALTVAHGEMPTA